MSRFVRLPVLVALVFALMAGACGDDDGGNTVASNSNSETTAPNGSGGTADDGENGDDQDRDDGDEPAGNVVELKSLRFNPDEITISAGETVTWVWKESVLHNVMSKDGDELDSGNHDSGEYEHTFEEPGTYEYVCTLHAGMDGVVEVE